MIQAKIIADSINEFTAKRITTWELTYPRFIHAEFMTHRVLSRSAASSRAIPIAVMIKKVLDSPAMPVWWGKNQAGMQAREELDTQSKETAKAIWLASRNLMIRSVEDLSKLGLHKQIANRLLEPWMEITVLATSTEWSNFYALRNHPDAQPEFQALASLMADVWAKSVPQVVPVHGWHIPFDPVDEGVELGTTDRIKVAIGRCARVSYLTHDGKRDHAEDIKLHDRLLGSKPPHMSPFEHVACALPGWKTSGNFVGWRQYRKGIPGESS